MIAGDTSKYHLHQHYFEQLLDHVIKSANKEMY